ncbi:hypothetical protein [Ammoniphilus resinae]|uniref:MFS family permease n=1 Tax=Ammoniphilus resinae TaxID=861532 RepID=A0ABS4GWY1_9BACL|nr:hypothetical protein [Ammoniphilus resinae]MBP1934769.1 MFS family permease [Ammoniphilus resinae]
MKNYLEPYINQLASLLSRKYSVKFFLIAVLIIFSSLVFQLIPIKTILIDVYSWHLIQPASYQGGVELIATYLLLILTVVFFKNNKVATLFSVVTISFLYLRMHQAFVPTILALFYFEIIFSIGCFVLRILKLKEQYRGLSDYYEYFVVGFSLFMFFTITISFFNYGGFNEVRILLCLLGILSLTKGVNKPFSQRVFVSFYNSPIRVKAGALFLFIIILMQFAKSAWSIDYDSVWYGLRPELVLIGENSFYDSLGLVQFVHYYPKLYELFLVPVSNLGDYSFIYAVTTLFLCLLFCLIYSFALLFTRTKFEAIFITLLIGSLPAIVNMGSTAKTDLFTTFFTLLAAYYFVKWIKDRNISILYGTIASILSFGGKVTSFIFTPLVIMGFLFAIFFYLKNNNYFYSDIKSLARGRKSNFYAYSVLLFVALISLFGICFRTYTLTGYPTYPVLTGLWSKLGFEVKYPLSSEHTHDFEFGGLSYIADRWINLLFNPKDYGHVIMLWPGNLTFYIFLISVVLIFINYNRFNTRSKPVLLISIPIIFGGALFATFLPNGGDGNYYIPALILATLVFYIPLTTTSRQLKVAIMAGLILFIPLQFTLTLVSHSSWAWGTDSFELNLNKSIFDSQEKNDNLLRSVGLWEIKEYLDKNQRWSRMVGFGDEQVLHRLPTRFEHIPGIGSEFLGNPKLIEDESDFLDFLKWAQINYLIFPIDDKELRTSPVYQSVFNVFDRLSLNPKVIKVQSEKYILLDITLIQSN